MMRAKDMTSRHPDWLPRKCKRRQVGSLPVSVSKAQRAIAMLGMSSTAVLVSMGCYSEPAHAAPKLKVLTAFTNLKGSGPQGGLLLDSAGNLYGTTQSGGANKDGVVFELSPSVGNKQWTETVLFSFNGANGSAPFAPLVADSAGNLYGTTASGGANNYGAVFELSPPIAGTTAWTETVLYSFFDSSEIGSPDGGVIVDATGNLYGVTAGPYTYGVVFELSPPAVGQTAWTETVLHFFNGDWGAEFEGYPESLLLDGAGNLYGTTVTGGYYNQGVAFELSSPTWAETVLRSFYTFDGSGPTGGLIADAEGNLYGTSVAGGKNRNGSVYELMPPIPGKLFWRVKVLYSGGSEGAYMRGGLIADSKRNLYGTATGGGANGDGVVFELVAPAEGKKRWTETVLYTFDGSKGAYPRSGLIADSAGNLYGTASSGGAHDAGTAFKVTP